MTLCLYLVSKKNRNLPQNMQERVQASVKNSFPLVYPFIGHNIWQSKCKTILAYEFYSPLTLLKCEPNGNVFFSVSGYLDADKEILKKVAADSAQQKQNFVRNCTGIFAIIFANEHQQNVNAYVPFHGVEHLFYGETQDFYVISNRATVISFLLNGRVKYNLSSFCGYINTHGLSSHFTFTDTPFEGVKTIPPGSELIISPSRIKLNDYDHQSEVSSNAIFDDLAQALIDHFSLIKKFNCNININITGGKDSRLLLAVATHLGLDIQGFTFGAPDTNDVNIGQRICQALDVPHTNKSLTPANGERIIDINKFINETLFMSEGMINGILNLKPTYPKSIKGVTLRGWGSWTLKKDESMRNLTLESVLEKKLMPSLPYLCKENAEAYKNRLFSWVMNERIANHCEFIDRLYLEHLSRWEASIIASFKFMGEKISIAPYLDNKFAHLSMSIPQQLMVECHYPHFELIRRFNDRLLQFPLGNDPWKLPPGTHMPKQIDMKLYPGKEDPSKAYRNINHAAIKIFVYRELFNKSSGDDVFLLCNRRKVLDLFKRDKLYFPQITFLWRLLCAKKTLANEWLTNDYQPEKIKFSHNLTKTNKDNCATVLVNNF